MIAPIMRRMHRLTPCLVAGLLLIGSACGDSGDDEPSAREAANGNAQSGARNLEPFLMRSGEEPGFSPDGDAFTVVGVDAFAEHVRLSQAEAQQVRTSYRTRGTGPRAASRAFTTIQPSPEGTSPVSVRSRGASGTTVRF